MLTATIFIIIVVVGYTFSLAKDPFWGLVTYSFVYFNCPAVDINWWAVFVPDLRWSLLSAVILLVSIVIHRDKISNHKLGVIFFLVVLLYVLIELLTLKNPVSTTEARYYAHNMQGYCLVIYLFVKVLADFENVRLYVLILIVLSAFLGLEGVLEGELIDGRLNNIGPVDAHGSNEFGLLLSAVTPFLIPFFIYGRKYEKIIIFLSLPFLVNGFTLTVSRGAMLALLAGLVYAYFLLADKKIKKYILISVICILPVFLYFTDQSYMTRLSSLWHVDVHSEHAVNDLSSGRMDIWKYSLAMVHDYPFGTGPGGFREISRYYMPPEILSYHPGRDYGVRAAHNTYLLVLVELGYPGIFCFLLLCATVLYKLFASSKVLKHIGKGDTFVDLFVVSLNMSIIATLFGGLVGSRFYYEFFWWQIALAIVVISCVERMEQSYFKEKGAS